MGQRYGRLVPERSTRVAGEPGAGATSDPFVASCLANHFELPWELYALRRFLRRYHNIFFVGPPRSA